MTSPNFEALKRSLDVLLWNKEAAPFRAVSFVLPVAPMPAPRARFTRDGYGYSPKPYITWRGNVAPHIPKLEPIIHNIRCAVTLDLVLPPYKTVSTRWPKGDIDNYEKAVWDIITKKGYIWKDDVQVCLSLTGKRFTVGDEIPHAQVYIREML